MVEGILKKYCEEQDEEHQALQLLIEKTPHNQFKIVQGECVEVEVLQVNLNNLIVDFNFKSEGLIEQAEYQDAIAEKEIKVGDKIKAVVLTNGSDSSMPSLSIDKARFEEGWHLLEKQQENDEIAYGKIHGFNKGGVIVLSNGVQGFIPISHLVGKTRELFLSKKIMENKENIKFKVIDISQKRNRAIFSEKAAFEEEKIQRKKELVEQLNVGDTVNGEVVGISNFGVFVDIGGADGLIHISELSWVSVRTPFDKVKKGEKLDVKVISIDKEQLKIALSLRLTYEDPWISLNSNFKEGQIIPVKITKLTDFGAFALIGDNIEGLIHIVEISEKTIQHASEELELDQVVNVKILKIDPERKRVALSIKQVNFNSAVSESSNESGNENTDEGETAEVEDENQTDSENAANT